MQLSPGTRLGPYEIISAIGSGGMGEVYKATDTRLNRQVAIKVMPPHFADDPDMKQRFDREAQTIAGLNHPNICTLHDIGRVRPEGASASQSEVEFLVMEFLEGETLADRIARGGKRSASAAASGIDSGAKSGPLRALSLDDAIRVAIAIADALDKAHRKGIVHRDLKPANVMLTKGVGATPVVKLLDFGLAKWISNESDSIAAMPTRAELSTPGMILGTLQYMAPEQVEGKDADARTDIFALGALLYEMIAGQRAFQGKSQATLISAIMTTDPPPLATLQPMTPAALDHVVRKCLMKDPEDRWQDAHSVLVQLQWIAQGRTESERPSLVAEARRKRIRVMRVALVGAAALIVALAVPAVLYVRGPDPAGAFPFKVPVIGLSPGDFAVAPNGREIAIVAQPDGQETTALYVRRLETPVFRRLPGTENAEQPFWSPDSRSIAYVVGRKLMRSDASGGTPKEIAPVTSFRGGTWSRNNTILFGSDAGLFTISAEGGRVPEAVTQLAKGETGHFWPSFLPDGVHYLFSAWSADVGERAVYAGALASNDRTRLMSAETNAVFAASDATSSTQGYLIFHRGASLFAQPFDAESRTLSGNPEQVVGGLSFVAEDGRGHFGASEAGVLVFDQSTRVSAGGRGRISNQEFGWISRTGEREGMAVPAGLHGDLDLSADERFIAVTRLETGAPAADIWVIDLKTGSESRLTSDPADDINPVWAPDSTRIAFTTYRHGNADIFVRNANGLGPETPLVQTPADEFVEAWSRDGRYVAYLVAGTGGFEDIYVMPLEGDQKPVAVVQGSFQKDEPQFSYDGKWLAYTSDESAPGKFEVYVISFPALDQKRKVSIGGGGQPRWRRDGRELFYRTVTDYVVVDLMLGSKLDSGVPRVMFTRPTGGPGNITSSDPRRHQWSAVADGQRFVVRVPPESGTGGRGRGIRSVANPAGPTTGRGRGGRGLGAPALTVILRWAASLEAGER